MAAGEKKIKSGRKTIMCGKEAEFRTSPIRENRPFSRSTPEGGGRKRGGGGGDKRRESKHPGTKTHDLFVLQMIKNTESNVLIFFSSELVP